MDGRPPGNTGCCRLLPPFLFAAAPLTPGGAPFPTPPAACPFAADHPAPGPTGRRRVRCPALQPRSPGHTPWPAGPRSLRPRPLPVHKAAAAALKAQAPGCLPAQASTFAAPALGGGGGFLQPGPCTSLAPRAGAQGTTVRLPAPGPLRHPPGLAPDPGPTDLSHAPPHRTPPDRLSLRWPQARDGAAHQHPCVQRAHLAEHTTTRGKTRRHTTQAMRRPAFTTPPPSLHPTPLRGRDHGPGSEHKGHS